MDEIESIESSIIQHIDGSMTPSNARRIVSISSSQVSLPSRMTHNPPG